MVPVAVSDLVERTTKLIGKLTGLRPVEVVGVSHDAQGWRIRVEMLELARIPPTTDVIAEYEVILDSDGSLLWFQRKRTRLRAQLTEDEVV